MPVLVEPGESHDGKPYVAIWYEGDIIELFYDWFEFRRFIHDALDVAAVAWPEQPRVK